MSLYGSILLVHPDFEDETLDLNIALIFLDDPV